MEITRPERGAREKVSFYAFGQSSIVRAKKLGFTEKLMPAWRRQRPTNARPEERQLRAKVFAGHGFIQLRRKEAKRLSFLSHRISCTHRYQANVTNCPFSRPLRSRRRARESKVFSEVQFVPRSNQRKTKAAVTFKSNVGESVRLGPSIWLPERGKAGIAAASCTLSEA